jgi:large subunit ribosomal protein L22
MEVKAIVKNTSLSPQKVQPLVDMIRGKKVDEALTLLKFAPTPAARTVTKAVKSAAANADNNFQMEPDKLKIVDIFTGKARTLRRNRIQARARITQILKRSCHITVIVAEQGE